MTHRRTRLLASAAAVTFAVLAIAGPASAHVTVNPNTATQGGYTKLTFRVPTESDTASTTKLQVFFPTNEPLASVSVKPHPGWKFTVTKAKLAKPIEDDDGAITETVSEITWTADSAATAIKPGEFDEFDVSVGPLPKAGSMEFKALQTYSDGSVVRWIESSTGGAEPEHPAPLLTLTKGSDAAPVAATSSSTDKASATDDSSDGRANAALVISIVALVLAVGAGTSGLVRRRKA